MSDRHHASWYRISVSGISGKRIPLTKRQRAIKERQKRDREVLRVEPR